MRRSEIPSRAGIVTGAFTLMSGEQLPFKVPPKQKVIEEMALKSNGRKLLITEFARCSSLSCYVYTYAQTGR